MDLLKYISYEINEKTYYPTFEIKLYDIFNYHIDIFETYTENDLPFIEEFFTFIFAIDKIRNEYNIEGLLERDITELLNKNQKIRLNIYKILLKCVCDLCYRHYGGGMGGYYSADYSLRNALDIFRNIPIRLNDQEMFTHMCHFYKEHLNKYFENGDVLKEYIKYNSIIPYFK